MRTVATMLFVSLLAAGISRAFAAEDVKIVNASFEDAKAEAKSPVEAGWEKDGAPPGWHCWIGSKAREGKPKLVWERNEGRTRQCSASLGSCLGGVCVIQSIPIEPKENYLATAWAKTTNPKSTTTLNIRWQTKDGKWANVSSASESLLPTVKPNEWIDLSVPFQAPDNAAFAVFLLTASDQKEGDKCWFDDVRLQHIGPEDIMIGPCGWMHPNCAPTGEPMETPHVKWAKPYAKGKLNVLFVLPNDHNLREHIEIAQRMDIEYDWVFAHEFDTALFALENKKIMKRLEEDYYDVIVIATRAKAPMVRGFAKHGKGILLMAYRHPTEREQPDGTKKVSWSSMIPEAPEEVKLSDAGQDHFICEPLDAMPAIPLTGDPSVYKIEVADGEKRLARITFNTRFTCLTPVFEFDDHLKMGGEYWEAYLQLIIRAILWTGSKEFPGEVALKCDGNKIALTLTDDKAKREIRFCDGVGCVFQGPGDLTMPTAAAAGPATAAVVLRDADGRSVGFGATRIDVKKPSGIAGVKPMGPHFLGKEGAEVGIKVEGNADGMKLTASLADAFGREHARCEADARSGENVLRLPLANRLSNFNWIHAKLMKNGETVDSARWYLLAPMDRKPFMDEFQIGTWASSASMPQYLHPALHQIMKEAGLTEGLQGANGYLSMLASGLWPISTTYGKIPGFSRWDKDDTVRQPCLSNPDDRRKMAEIAKETAAAEIGANPLMAYLRDETSLVKDDRDLDVCSCEHCRKRFRAWLQERYKGLDDLNKEWATDYKSWDDLGFSACKDVRDKETFAPWLMYRRFMDWTWAEGIEWSAKNAHRGDPGILVGMPNTFGPNPFSGRDYYYLSKVNEYRLEYPRETRSVGGTGACYDALRSFAPQVRDHPWIGYRFDDETILYAPWWSTFHGATGFSVYGTMSLFAGKNSWAQIFPTLQHTRRGKMYADQAKELKEGIGKIIIEGRRAQAPIAILWSQPSMYVAWAISGQTGHPMVKSKKNPYEYYFTSRETFRLAVVGSGRQFDYVVEEQIKEGALKNYSCLVLPACYALGDDTAEVLTTFVENGGTVIADMGVGLTNGVGARRRGGDLPARLFGVQRKESDLKYEEREARLKLSPNPLALLGREKIEAAAGTECEAYEDGIPAVVRMKRGNGRTIFLNFVTKQSSDLRGIFDGQPQIGEVTSLDGAHHPADYDLVEFEMGGSRYLGVTHNHLNDDPNYETVRIKLAKASETYDVRARKHLGKVDAIEANIPPGHAAFYALLAYRVTDVEVSCEDARQGARCDVSCQVKADGQPGDHVVHVDVLKPDGGAHPAYGRNVVAKAGKAAFAVPFALNDPLGKWTIVCRDVASGIEGRRELVLKE